MNSYATELPLLAEERMDYVNSEYRVSVTQGEDKHSMDVRHEVRGKNLIVSMLKKSEAVFAIEISSPHATFREIDKSDVRGKISCTQKVSWDAATVVSPVYIRPLIVTEIDEPQSIRLSTEEHGVHSIWHERKIQLRSGSILAADRFWAFRSTFESLLRLVTDPEGKLRPGEYRVEANTSEGFYFQVFVHSDLFHFLVNPGEQGNYRDGIFTSALIVGFETLQREYQENWEEYPVLKELHKMLENKGIPAWDEDNFHAEIAATRFRPFKFDASEVE